MSINVQYSESGCIKKISLDEGEQNIRTTVALDDFEVTAIKRTELSKGLEFKKTLVKKSKTITLTETFTEQKTGIRWDVEIVDQGVFWSTPVHLKVDVPVTSETRFWTAWSDPRGNISGDKYNNEKIANAEVSGISEKDDDWSDPLTPVAFRNERFFYGAPYYEYDNPRVFYCPFQGDVFCIPMVSVMNENGTALSLILSPEDLLLDLYMDVTEDGGITMTHLNHRLGQGRSLKFSMDLAVHAADWRASLNEVYTRYPYFF